VTASREKGGYSGADLSREICRKVLLKRYVFPVAAVLAFALGFTGVALANGHPTGSGHRH